MMFLKILQNLQKKKNLCQSLYVIKFQTALATLLRNRFWHIFLPVTF